jgi:ribosome-associated protein
MDWNDEPEQDEEAELRPPSKSQRKRDMNALQELGEALVALPESALRKIALPDELRDAVHEARAIKAHGGRKRQLQYIGKLMRGIDAAPIQAALEQRTRQARSSAHQFHLLEQWRDRLLSEGDAVIEEFCSAYPEAERQRLRQLVRQAGKEQEQGAAPKSARQLFRYLREVTEA